MDEDTYSVGYTNAIGTAHMPEPRPAPTQLEMDLSQMTHMANCRLLITGEAFIVLREPDQQYIGTAIDINKAVRVFIQPEDLVKFLKDEQAKSLQKTMG